MIYFICFFISFTFVYLILMFWTFRNPYKLIMLFGGKGSGKTTLMTKWAIKYLNRGKVVYANFYVPGVRLYDPDNYGKYTFEKGSVVFCDEVGMIWDNRKFKSFSDYVRDWFKLQRQYKCTVILASQAWDIDSKLRNLTDYLYICECKLNFISVARKIKRKFKVVDPIGDSESRIADQLELEPIWLSLFGARSCILTHIPSWTKYFKSFNPPELPPMPYDYQEIPDNLSQNFKYLGLVRNQNYKKPHEFLQILRDIILFKFLKKEV